MDPALLWLLFGCAVWAAGLMYFFVVRRADDAGAGGRSAAVVLAGLLVPLITLVLWHQSQSTGRLEDLGVVLHPALGPSVGVATGAGDPATWLYESHEAPERVLEFYRQPSNHPGWRLESEANGMLLFHRGDQQLTLQVSAGKAAFMLQHGARPDDP